MKEARHGLDFYLIFAIKLIKKWKKVTGYKFYISDEAIGGVANALIKSELTFDLDKIPEDRRKFKTDEELMKAYMLSNGIRYIQQFASRNHKRKKSRKTLVLSTDIKAGKDYKTRDPFDYTSCRNTQHESVLDDFINQENREKNYKSYEINLVIESAGLTELEKKIIYMRYWDGLSLAKIDRLNNTSHNAAFDTCERAKKKIAKAMLGV